MWRQRLLRKRNTPEAEVRERGDPHLSGLSVFGALSFRCCSPSPDSPPLGPVILRARPHSALLSPAFPSCPSLQSGVSPALVQLPFPCCSPCLLIVTCGSLQPPFHLISHIIHVHLRTSPFSPGKLSCLVTN